MEKIEVILTDCIKEIRSGKTTMAESLESYPSMRRELEPLLRMALNIQEPPAFNLDPAYKQSARTQLLQQIRTAKTVKPKSWGNLFSFGLPPQLVWARAAVAIMIGMIVISVLGGGTAYAAKNSLPGEMLYTVKTGTEEIRLWMADNYSVKAELNLVFAQTRLVELNQLTARNSSQTELAVQGYRNNLQAAESNLQSITNAANRANTLERFSQKLRDQLSYCDVLVDATYGKNLSIRQAADLAVAQQIDVFTNLAQQDNLLAARANLDMMQDRLQRAQAKAIEQQYQTMQVVLFQYQQFNELGQWILQNAHNSQKQTTEIDNLSAIKLQSYLEILNTIFQQVPQGYRNEIETSQTMTMQFQNQARYGYPHQGGTNGGSDQTPGQGSGPGPGPVSDTTPSSGDSGTTLEPGSSTTSQPQGTATDTGHNLPINTPSSTPGNGGDSGSGGGSGDGSNPDSGGSGTNQPNNPPNTGGNTGTGGGSGVGDSTGAGGSLNSISGNTSGSTGGSSS